MPSVCSACAPRVSGVGPARSGHGWRSSVVYIHASSSAHSVVHAQKSRRTRRTTTNAQRWSSALDARVAHGDAHPANDDELAKIATFQCAGRASCRCDWRFSDQAGLNEGPLILICFIVILYKLFVRIE